jgi:8-oxo-dGTP pyrophosphatase MutT (NUDIX family)
LKRATRVSGILVTPSGPLLVIRRERPGVSVYRILPGGSIEPGDGDLEATVRREMREETGATPTDLRLVAALEESEDYAEPRLDHHSLLGSKAGPKTSRLRRSSPRLARAVTSWRTWTSTPEALDGANLLSRETRRLIQAQAGDVWSMASKTPASDVIAEQIAYYDAITATDASPQMLPSSAGGSTRPTSSCSWRTCSAGSPRRATTP